MVCYDELVSMIVFSCLQPEGAGMGGGCAPSYAKHGSLRIYSVQKPTDFATFMRIIEYEDLLSKHVHA